MSFCCRYGVDSTPIQQYHNSPVLKGFAKYHPRMNNFPAHTARAWTACTTAFPLGNPSLRCGSSSHSFSDAEPVDNPCIRFASSMVSHLALPHVFLNQAKKKGMGRRVLCSVLWSSARTGCWRGSFSPDGLRGAPLARSRSPSVFSLFFVRCMYGLPSAPPAELVVVCRWVVIPTGYRAFPPRKRGDSENSHFFGAFPLFIPTFF